ncbi:Protein of unknown function DUF2084 [Rhodomicrobium vannielii ATCC 17100]|jgi:uncharacterized protein YjhX (UPF0386 family)|uniref:UPF0386 protein Rvan_2158 n=1 Tax=Rhodomicrobium vannielii (strain ATCC 17100 / DSM 162 / LMG 4299 / NCIMB 10020 / ATH 3.1.1) TaxID=648757 RepID=E3I2M4_RHOVT|nr:YjhX family toxin [Rhodomicrobium vannielii]ADP71383.1 Protein of unknown function DUF2084 [Rhodomicrobium vannielii ATCC 17100]MBJ7534357.1 YjhX family toxin [Rhodomicrobium vannielii ATCC 17100]
MNISKYEQRTLHALAQGGYIRHVRNGKSIIFAECITRDGYRLVDCSLDVFNKLRRRGLIRSSAGGPYRISPLGLSAVRSQADNR